MAGTTPVLSARSFLFVVQVPLATHEERVTHWWYFSASSVTFIGLQKPGNGTNGQFSSVEITELSLPLGQEVKLERGIS